MITIEDLIIKTSYNYCAVLNPHDFRILRDFADQIGRNFPLTEKQGNLSIKILKKYRKSLDYQFNFDVSIFLENPVFKFPFRQINSTKSISIIERADTKDRYFKVEFPYNQKYIDLFKSQRTNLDIFTWDKEEKAWLFSLSEKNVNFLIEFSSRERFSVDEQFNSFATQTKKIINELELHVPMLVKEENSLKFKNTNKLIPRLNTENTLEAIFEARKYGIFTWDNTILKFIENYENVLIKNFIKNDPMEKTFIDPATFDIFELESFVKYLNPCLFVIPPGKEFEKTKIVYDFLKKIGIENEEINVLFRLSSTEGKQFNDFVKNGELNSPISEKTKAVLISGKLPKTVIKSKIKFNSIFSLDVSVPHYIIENYLKNHENVIFYASKKEKQRGPNWLQLEL